MEEHRVKPWLHEFATKMIIEYNIDDSHGMTHCINTRNNCAALLESIDGTIIEGLSRADSDEVCLDAAFVHDVGVDSKYMEEAAAVSRVRNICRENNYTDEKTEILIYIITHISYRKCMVNYRAGIPMIEEGRLKLATQIVRDADLLDAYSVERCCLFQDIKYKNMPDGDEKRRLVRGWIKTILVSRVLTYISLHLTTDLAKELAVPQHKQVEEYVAANLADAEIFKY